MNTHGLHIKKLIDQSKNIAIFGHINPDGDCIGALLGLGRILEKQGKKVSYFTPTKPSRIFGFLPGIQKIMTKFDYKAYDLLILVDVSSYLRIAPFTENQKYFDESKMLLFDHHPGNTPKHALVLKDIHAMSCSEIIFEYAQKRWKKYLDKEIATYFYLGLMMDSGNFVFDQDHERIFRNALALVKLGANKTLVNNNIIRKKSLSQIQFLGLLIKRIQVKGDVLFSYYQDSDLKKFKIDQEEAGYGLNVIQNIDGPKVIVLMRKIANSIRGSIRSKDSVEGEIRSGNSVDCNEIAKQFGGGGHRGAAGFTLQAQGSFLKQIQSIAKTINTHIK